MVPSSVVAESGEQVKSGEKKGGYCEYSSFITVTEKWWLLTSTDLDNGGTPGEKKRKRKGDIVNAVALSGFGLLFQGFSQLVTRLGHLAVRVLQVLDHTRLMAIRPVAIHDKGWHLLPWQG